MRIDHISLRGRASSRADATRRFAAAARVVLGLAVPGVCLLEETVARARASGVPGALVAEAG